MRKPLLILQILVLTATVSGSVIHVPGDFPTIQAGIDAAVDGDEVLIADGTFTGEGNRDIEFRGKTIIVRSEHGAGSTVIDCEQEGHGFLFIHQEGRGSRLEGVTITGGVNSGIYPDYYGGGIYCEGAPTITECIVAGCRSSSGGGGIHCFGPACISKCSIIGNTSEGDGGGIMIFSAGAVVTSCIVSGNEAATQGGGIHCRGPGEAAIAGCVIESNTAGEEGGGLHLSYYAEPRVRNCIIAGNRSNCNGGGIACRSESHVRLTNCTVTGNIALGDGGGLFSTYFSKPMVTNCILRGDDPDEIFIFTGRLTVVYSDIEGGWDGEGNIDADPLFTAFHGFDCLLRPGSPCIDAGDPLIEDGLNDTHPLWPDWYPDGPRSDMGAYGGPLNRIWVR